MPKLSDVTWHWQHDFISDDSPEERMQPLLASYKSLKEELAIEPALVRMIEREISSVEDWIAEDMAEYAPQPDRSPRTFGELDAPKEQQDRMRSIFDDVDQ